MPCRSDCNSVTQGNSQFGFRSIFWCVLKGELRKCGFVPDAEVCRRKYQLKVSFCYRENLYYIFLVWWWSVAKLWWHQSGTRTLNQMGTLDQSTELEMAVPLNLEILVILWIDQKLPKWPLQIFLVDKTTLPFKITRRRSIPSKRSWNSLTK